MKNINIPSHGSDTIEQKHTDVNTLIEGTKNKQNNILSWNDKTKERLNLSESIAKKSIEDREELINEIFLKSFLEKAVFMKFNDQFGTFLDWTYEKEKIAA